jgi:O-antigen/teichoic acid export membrane protein
MAAPFALRFRTLVIALGQGVTKTGSLLVMLYFVRTMSADDWATMAFSLTIYVAALGFGSLSLHESVYFFFTRTMRSDRRGLVLQTTLLLMAGGLLCAGLVTTVAALFADHPIVDQASLNWLALALVFEIATLATPKILLAAERPTASAVYSSVMAIAQLLALLVPVVLGLPQVVVWQSVAAYAVLRFLFSSLLLISLKLEGTHRLRRDMLAEQIMYSLPLALALGASVFNRSFDKWIVAWLDADNFGAYAVAAQEIPLISIVPYAMSAVMATRMVHAIEGRDLKRALAYWMAKATRMTLVILPVVTAVLISSEDLVVLLFTESQIAAVLPFQIYTFVLFHRVAEYGLVLRSGGDTRSLWLATLLLMCTNVVLTIPLVLQFGMAGAAVGTLIGNAVAWPFVLSRIARMLSVSFRQVFPWRLYANVLLLCLVCAIATRLLPDTESRALDVLIKSILFFVLYAGSIKLLRLAEFLPVVPEEDPHFIESISAAGSVAAP